MKQAISLPFALFLVLALFAGLVYAERPATDFSNSDTLTRTSSVSGIPVESDPWGVHTRAYGAFSVQATRAKEVQTQLVSERNEPSDAFTYRYARQTWNGYPVYGAQVTSVSNQNRDVLSDQRIFPSVRPSNALSLSAQDAAALIRPMPSLSFEGARVVLYPLFKDGSFDYRYAWELRYPVDENQKIAMTFWVDAQDGNLLHTENRLVFDSIFGQVTGSVFLRHTLDAQVSRPLRDLFVNTTGQSALTNASGQYQLSSVIGAQALLSKLSGPYVFLENQAQPSSNMSQLVVPPVNFSWSWSSFDLSASQEETNVFYHANLIHDFYKIRGVSELDFPMKAMVAINAQCNAWASGDTIAFYKQGGGCKASSLGADIIYHEYTHNAIFALYRGVDIVNDEYWSIHEGLADFVAATITDDPMIGEDIFPQPLRYLNRTVRYSEKTGEPHADGRIIGGAFWDLRTALGANVTETLLLRALRMHGQTIPEFASNVLVADDDNANLSDGTPHKDVICNAFYEKRGVPARLCVPLPPSGTQSLTFSNATSVPIRDFNYSHLTINVSAHDNQSIALLRVFVNVEHDFIGDVRLTLTDPSGQSAILHPVSFDSSNDLVTWYENESAASSGLSFFFNRSPTGVWKLEAYDALSGFEGNLSTFGLNFFLSGTPPIVRTLPIEFVSPKNGTSVRSKRPSVIATTQENATCVFRNVRCDASDASVCPSGNFSPMSITGQSSHYAFLAGLTDTPFGTYFNFTARCLNAFGISGSESLVYTVNLTDVEPPFISPGFIDLGERQPGDNLTFSAFIQENTDVNSSGIAFVQAILNHSNGTLAQRVDLFDDGLHGDGSANDSTYSGRWLTNASDVFSVSLTAADRAGNRADAPLFHPLDLRFPTSGAPVLVVGGSDYFYNFSRYHLDALKAAGIPAEQYQANYYVVPPFELLVRHKAVVWEQAYNQLKDADREKLARYLDAGGRLFISGQFFPDASAFQKAYLGSEPDAYFINLYAVNGTQGDAISDGLNFALFGGDGANNQYFPSSLRPLSGSQTLFTYDPNATTHTPLAPLDRSRLQLGRLVESNRTLSLSEKPVAGVRFAKGSFKTVSLSFGFESIPTRSDRSRLMSRIMDWFYPAANVSVSNPSNRTYADSSLLLSFQAERTAVSLSFALDQNAPTYACFNCSQANLVVPVTDGAHALTVFSENELNRTANAAIRFTIDAQPPLLLIGSPLNLTYRFSTLPMNLQAADPSNLSSVRYRLDASAEKTLVSAPLAQVTVNVTLSGISDGSHTLMLIANDSLGHERVQSVNFTVDSLAPNLLSQAAFPENSSAYVPNGTVRFNATFNKNIQTAILELDGVNFTAFRISAGTVSFNASLSAKNHTVRWHAVDDAGNYNRTASFTYVVQKAQGQAFVFLNASASNLTSEFPASVNVTGWDNVSDLHDRILSTSAAFNGTVFTPSAPGLWTFNVSISATENFTGTVSAPLAFNVTDFTAPRFFNATAFLPVYFDENATYLLNVSWLDNHRVAAKFFEFDGQRTALPLNASFTSSPISGLLPGNHTYRWIANDSSGNQNQTPVLRLDVRLNATSAQNHTLLLSPGLSATATLSENALLRLDANASGVSNATFHNLTSITPPTPPAGFTSLSAFEINVTTNASLFFCLDYEPYLSQYSESSLSVFEYNATASSWVDITVSRDTQTRTVCGRLLSGHTPYMAAGQPLPSPTPTPSGSSGGTGGGSSGGSTGGSQVTTTTTSSGSSGSSGAIGGSGGGASRDSFVIFGIPDSLSVPSGQAKITRVTIASYYTGFLNYANVTIKGIPSSWYAVSRIPYVTPISNTSFDLAWSIPEGNAGSFPVTLELSGLGSKNTGTLRSSRSFTLVIFGNSRPQPFPTVTPAPAPAYSAPGVFPSETVSQASSSNSPLSGFVTFQASEQNVTLGLISAALLLFGLYVFKREVL